MELRSRSNRSLQRPGSAPYAVWFIIIDHHRQAPGQARWASLSAERSAGTVFLFVPAERLHNLRE
jgi:hypothetical protein